jgi:hypothetical protein
MCQGAITAYLDKLRKTVQELRMVVVPAEIRTRHLPNITRIEACRDVLYI